MAVRFKVKRYTPNELNKYSNNQLNKIWSDMAKKDAALGMEESKRLYGVTDPRKIAEIQNEIQQYHMVYVENITMIKTLIYNRQQNGMNKRSRVQEEMKNIVGRVQMYQSRVQTLDYDIQQKKSAGMDCKSLLSEKAKYIQAIKKLQTEYNQLEMQLNNRTQ